MNDVVGRDLAKCAAPSPDIAVGEPLLEVRNLRVTFSKHHAVDDLSFSIGRGKTVALVGESGSGKSTVALAIMGLLSSVPPAETGGSIILHQDNKRVRDLSTLSAEQRRCIRGKDIAMIFQDPMSSLNPIYSIRSQLCEAIRAHQLCSKAEAQSMALDLLFSLGVPSPANCLTSYPHQLSGGMRQRVMIAMALASKPSLLIADEPTTALDVTIQAQLLDLLMKIQWQTEMAILFITHNLGVVAEMADEVLVMYDGQLVEQGPTACVLGAPVMPYTKALVRAVPRLGRRRQSGDVLATIPGQAPSPADLREGCRFYSRCSHADAETCHAHPPTLEYVDASHLIRCFKWKLLERAGQ